MPVVRAGEIGSFRPLAIVQTRRATALEALQSVPMDDALLRKLREQSGLRLDREGRFWHRGDLLEHARTIAALHRGLHRAEDGRWAVRIGPEWGYVDVEDAGRFVRRIVPGADGLSCQLATGEWVDVDPATLAAGSDDALYVRLCDGERARLTRAAQLSLADHLHEGEGSFFLELGQKRHRIGRDQGPEAVRRG
jgi:uncharacterized protein